MKASNDAPLTPRQERFAQLVGGGMNQSEAYRQAYPTSQKWKPDGVHQKASTLAADVRVRERVAAMLADTTRHLVLERVKVLREVAMLAHSDIGSIMKDDGSVKLPHELDPVTRAAVSSFKIDEYGRIEYKFWDKNAAIEKAMKHLGLYEVDHKQKADALSEVIASLSGNVMGPAAGADRPEHMDEDGDE